VSDNWEVKKVEKSGDGFWINVQPSYSDSGAEGPAHLFNVVVMSMAFMSWFGITGFWGWAICATMAGVITAFLYVPSLIFSLVTVVYFLFW
jgi:hypothetical protein